MTRKVIEWRDERAANPRAADIAVQVLRTLLEYGRLRGMVSLNVAKGIPHLYRGANRAAIVWTDEDLARFSDSAIKLDRLPAADGVRLAALTGLRREDLVTLTWDEIKDVAIVKTAAKASRGKRRTVTIPRHLELNALLIELQTRPREAGVKTVLVSSRGTPWSKDGFSHAFSEVRDHAGIFHAGEGEAPRAKHMHDLRGTFCTKLVKQGLNEQEVADVMGWSPEQVRGIRRSYVDPSQIVVAIGERLKGGS